MGQLGFLPVLPPPLPPLAQPPPPPPPACLHTQAGANGASAPIDLSELTAVGPLDGWVA